MRRFWNISARMRGPPFNGMRPPIIGIWEHPALGKQIFPSPEVCQSSRLRQDG